MDCRFAALLVALVCGSGLQADQKMPPRAKPPEWPSDVVDVFFDDARDHLVGSRPNYEAAATRTTSDRVAATTGGASSTADSATDDVWTSLVDADTLETEIKRQLPSLQPLVATPSAFKGGGYREARDRFTWLATLFSVAGQYNDPVRWQDSADGLAQLFARAGFNCKVGTDQTFRESQLRVQDLTDLVRGGRPEVPDPQPDVGWDRLADRSPLMKQMEAMLGERIVPNASDGLRPEGQRRRPAARSATDGHARRSHRPTGFRLRRRRHLSDVRSRTPRCVGCPNAGGRPRKLSSGPRGDWQHAKGVQQLPRRVAVRSFSP